MHPHTTTNRVRVPSLPLPQLRAEDAQLEGERKEAAVKAQAAVAAAAKAHDAAAAAASADHAVAHKLQTAHVLDAHTLQEILDHVKKETGATGVYLAVKDGDAGAIAGPDDDEAPKAKITYVGASSDHQFMLHHSVQQPKGATFPVWVRPPKEEEEVEEEELEVCVGACLPVSVPVCVVCVCVCVWVWS